MIGALEPKFPDFAAFFGPQAAVRPGKNCRVGDKLRDKYAETIGPLAARVENTIRP
jgi:hypothetical protein